MAYSKGDIAPQFPVMGIDKAVPGVAQTPGTTANAVNVRPDDLPEGRNRGGSRPGLTTAFAEQLGSGTKVQLLSQLNTTREDKKFWSDSFAGSTLADHWLGFDNHNDSDEKDYLGGYSQCVLARKPFERFPGVPFLYPAQTTGNSNGVTPRFISSLDASEAFGEMLLAANTLPDFDATETYTVRMTCTGSVNGHYVYLWLQLDEDIGFTDQGQHGTAENWQNKPINNGVYIRVGGTDTKNNSIRIEEYNDGAETTRRTGIGDPDWEHNGSFALSATVDSDQLTVTVTGGGSATVPLTPGRTGSRMGFMLNQSSVPSTQYQSDIDLACTRFGVEYGGDGNEDRLSRRCIAVANGQLYYENDFGEMEPDTSAVKLNPNVMLQGVDLLSKFYIADHGDEQISDAGTLDSAGTTITFADGNHIIDSGSSTGTTANKLAQAAQTFSSTVTAGSILYAFNTTDSTFAEVDGVDSDTQLDLAKNIFVSGEAYIIAGPITSVASGTTTTRNTGRIVDSSQSFTTTVSPGDYVYNTSEGKYTTVASVPDDQTVILTAAIFGGLGEDWIISESAPAGLSTVDSGTTDGTTTDKLVDSSQDFTTTVTSSLNTYAFNLTDKTFATVDAINSDTQLDLDADIFTSGEQYVVAGPIVSVDDGDTSGQASNKLIDVGQNFVTTVTIGDAVYNLDTGTYTTVTAIDDNENLSLADDIFLAASGESYKISENEPSEMDIQAQGWTTAAATNKLIQAGQDFTTSGIEVGDAVHNTTDGSHATITAIDDDDTLSLSADIFTGGEEFLISKINPDYHVLEMSTVTSGGVAGTYEISYLASTTTAVLATSATDGTSGGGLYRVGRSAKVYDPSAAAGSRLTHFLTTDITNKGSVPFGCNLICQYRERLCLAGDPYNAQLWYMARQSDPDDWNYFPTENDVGRAVAGNNVEAGSVGEQIFAMLSHSNDYLIFGSKTGLHVLTGDPSYGGQLDILSSDIGMLSRDSWCHGPLNELIFLTRDGIYVNLRGVQTPVQSLSRERIPRELLELDTKKYQVSMAYDPQERGIHVMVSAYDSTVASNHFFVKWPNPAFFRMDTRSDFDTFQQHSYSGDTDDANGVILGCRDGYIRRFSFDTYADDGYAVTSAVMIGPFYASDNTTRDGIIMELMMDMDDDGKDVTMSIVSGKNPAEAIDKGLSLVSEILTDNE